MKKGLAILLAGVLLISLTSCASSREKYDAASPREKLVGNAADLKPKEADGTESVKAPEEKMIKTVNLTVQTRKYDEYVSATKARVSELNGYIERSVETRNGYGSDDSRRSSDYTIRIPSERLDEFLAGTEEKGKIISKSENQENAALEYVDVQSRIDAYKAEKEALMQTLKKAESLEDVLAVRERLSDVNYQLDAYVSKLRILQNKVTYASVNMDICEIGRAAENDPSIRERIKEGFLKSSDRLKDAVVEIVVGFFGGLPVIVPAVALAAAVFLIIRAIIRKRTKK